ncbi:MAG TPA: response regulator, partial [Candidatus Binatia bacterium]|nr:response regulator [Candidatus Binatia bacterium]
MNPVPHPPVARVLLVDDEPMVLASLRETLRHEGYTLAVANSAEEALELARQHTFGVIVSDQQMPAMTGIELLAEMKKLHPEAARILISA